MVIVGYSKPVGGLSREERLSERFILGPPLCKSWVVFNVKVYIALEYDPEYRQHPRFINECQPSHKTLEEVSGMELAALSETPTLKPYTLNPYP